MTLITVGGHRKRQWSIRKQFSGQGQQYCCSLAMALYKYWKLIYDALQSQLSERLNENNDLRSCRERVAWSTALWSGSCWFLACRREREKKVIKKYVNDQLHFDGKVKATNKIYMAREIGCPPACTGVPNEWWRVGSKKKKKRMRRGNSLRGVA